MTASTEMIESWVASHGDDSPDTLGTRYAGADSAMLNADQVVDVVNGLWREYCEAHGAAAADNAGWSYVSGGTTKTILTCDGIELGVERFCGGWPVSDKRTAKLLTEIFEATPENQRP